MLDIDAEIVPAISIGGVAIGSELQDVVTSMSEKGIAYDKRVFSTFGRDYVQVSSNRFGVTIVGDDNGRVVRVSCRAPYQGKYKGCFPGMTVAQLRQITDKQLVIHGMIIPDAEYGIAFDIPEEFEGKQFDDINDIEQLPPGMPLVEIHVLDREWWR